MENNMKRCAIYLLATVFVTMFGSTAFGEEQRVVVRFLKEGFQLTYPPDWIMTNVSSGSVVLWPAEWEKQEPVTFETPVRIDCWDSPRSATPEKLYEKEFKEASTDVSAHTEEAEGMKKLPNGTNVFVYYDWTMGGEKVYIATKGKKVCTISSNLISDEKGITDKNNYYTFIDSFQWFSPKEGYLVPSH